MDNRLLDILVCPETKQPLRLADPALVQAANSLIGSGSLRNRSGQVITELISAILVRDDGLVAYAVRDDIPIMLIEESIALPV